MIGKWKSDPGDASTKGGFGEVTMTFHADGRLIYVVHSPKKDDVMRLVYTVRGDELVTDQPGDLGEHRTKFRFDDQGRLILEDEGELSRYVRVK